MTNDERMKDAIDLVVAKSNTKGRWAREPLGRQPHTLPFDELEPTTNG